MGTRKNSERGTMICEKSHCLSQNMGAVQIKRLILTGNILIERVEIMKLAVCPNT